MMRMGLKCCGLMVVLSILSVIEIPIDVGSGISTWRFGSCAIAAGEIDDGPFNRAPVAVDDAYVRWGWTWSPGDIPPLPMINPFGLLDNDSDPDGDVLTVISYGNAVYGKLVVRPNGGFDYDVYANVDVGGLVDTITYTISDTKGATATATLNFVLQQTTPGNSPPVVEDDSYSTPENTTLRVGAPGTLINDGDEQNDTLHAVMGFQWLTNGTLVLHIDGSFEYTPNQGFSGLDSYTYDVVDGHGGSTRAVLTFEVTPLSPPPAALGTLRGVVTDGHTGDPVGATVTVSGEGSSDVVSTNPVTGAYAFELLTEIGHTVQAEAEGYLTETITAVSVLKDSVTTLDIPLFPSNELPQIDVGLDQGGGASCAALVYLPLDDQVGTIAYDASGHDYNGTLVGHPEWIEGPPGFGSALAFTRTNYVELVDETPFDLVDTITVAAWACIDQIGAQWSPIVAKGNSAWRLSTVADQRRFHFAVTSPAVGPHWVNGVTNVGFGEWHHLAGTYDGMQIHLYVDGVEDPASPVPYTGPISTNDYPVWVGGNAQFPGNGFTGRIDDVRIFNRSLSQTEIKDLSEPEGFLWVHEVIDNGPVVDQTACFASLDSGTGTQVDYTLPVLNILDGGENGHFVNDDVFGVVEQGFRNLAAVDDLCMEALGFIRIGPDQAGDWTFGVNSDDGFSLLFFEQSFDTVTNGELVPFPDGTALRYSGNRAAQDTLGTINLPAGDHPFWLIYHEHLGGAGVEFFAAPGIHDTFDSDVFRLVGQRHICDLAVPGLCEDATMVATRPGAWGAIRSIADARAALAQGQTQETNALASVSVINHSDPDFGGPVFGLFSQEASFPINMPGRNENDFAVKVTGRLDIPADGTYQIGFNSDDGVSLRINGQTWTAIVEDATGNAVIMGDELINDSITGWSLTVGEIELTAGCHPFEAIMFEAYGGAFLELLGRGVSLSGMPDPAWHLLKVGGAQFPAQVKGLQLVP